MMKTHVCLVLLTLLGCQVSLVQAADNPPAPAHQTPTDNLFALSQSTAWHRLLLYKNHKKSSLIENATNTKFFVSGKFDDPHAELVANIEKLSNPTTRGAFACQFPARTHWLISQLPYLGSDIRLDDCEEFNDFKSQIDAKQLSLIYAEEHINRVGSFFAHTLIKVDNTQSLATHSSDDAYYINFATDEMADNSMIRTVQGKNPAAMTVDKFTQKQASYLINDERDLWEFAIDLPQNELDQIMRHLWEVKDLYRHYNFLDNNCASEILRLLDVANDARHLIKDAGKIVSPNEVGRVLQQNQLLKSHTLQPSRRSMLAHGMDIDEATYAQLMTDGSLPQIDKSTNNPLSSAPVHRINFDIGHNNVNDTAYTIGFRGAYQDFLDRADGKRKFIYTNIAEVNVLYDEQLTLKNATLIDFLSLNPKNAPLPKASYGGHLKLDRVNDWNGDTPLVLSVGGRYGQSWQVGDRGLCHTLATGTVQAGKVEKGYRLGVGANVGCAYHFNDKMRGVVDVAVPLWYKERGYVQPKAMTGVQYDINRKLGVRATADYERLQNGDKKGIGVGVVRYFD